MKRFLSMVLALALVLTTLMVPVYADEAAGEVTAVAVDITSITNGETFAAGGNVKLAADASGIEGVSHIDFYANGAKLPGTIVGNKGELVWYGLTEGVYDITTKVTYNGEPAATAWGNETVRIVVVPADTSKITKIWPDGQDAAVSGVTEYEYVDDFAAFGAKALKIVPEYGKVARVNYSRTEKLARTWNRAVVVVYVPEAIEGLFVYGEGNSDSSTRSGQRMVGNGSTRAYEGDLTVKQGINRFVTQQQYGADEVTKNLDWMRINFGGVPEGNDKPIYILGFYGMSTDLYSNPVIPVATAELGDAAENVCNEIDTYRINFDSPIFPDATKVPATVTYDVEGVATEVEDVTYSYGTNYVDLHLPTLNNTTTYTVSIPENTILSYYSGANTYVAATDFTFTTKDDICGSATAVAKMSYPKAGSTALADTGFAAQLVAPNSTINAVKFYNGETEIAGTVTAGTDGEYWLTPDAATLTAGVESTITAKFLNIADDETETVLATASATYTGATTPSYFVKGIYDGAVVVKTHETSRKITVSDAANATKVDGAATAVAKVEFYDVPSEGEKILLDTVVGAPYSYDLAFSETGAKTIEVRVYDNFGGVHPFISNYTVEEGVKSLDSIDLDFENTTIEAVTTELINNNSGNLALSIEEFNGSNALKLAGTATSGWKYAVFNRPDPTTGYKVHYIEFDYATSGSYSSSVSTRTVAQSGTTTNLIATNKNIYTDLNSGSSFGKDVVHKVALVIDCNGTEYAIATVNIDGKEWKRLNMTEDNLTRFALHIGANGKGYSHIDNFKHSVYEVAPEYAVKGIYDGATMVKEEEGTRTITVVDKANADVVSTEATGVSKVEFYVDDVLANTDEDGTDSWSYALANDSYGAHKLEVKVTDIYGEVHSFVYNYNVVEGVENTTYSIEEDFAEGTDAELASVFNTVHSNHTLSANNGGVKVTSNASSKNSPFKAAPTATGRKVHYYEFDLLTAGYSPSFNVNGTALFNTYTDVTTNETANSYFTNKLPVRMKVVFDCDQTTSVATISFKGKDDAGFSEWKRVEFATPEELKFNVNLGNGYAITIDNFKYSVYDYPSRYGFGEFEDEVTFNNTGRQQFTTYFTNTTDADVTVKYFVVTYEADGRMHFVYKDDSRLDKPSEANPNLASTWTVTYPAGSIDAENTFRLNIGEAGENWTARIYGYVVDAEGNVDITPIADFE